MPPTRKATGTNKKKKPPVKKLASSGKDPQIKYADKSQGQPQLVPIFEEISKLLAAQQRGTLKLYGGTDGKALLISKKPVEIFGKKRDELWFASVLVQKGYVGFYYMPVYSDKGVRDLISPDLLKYLKGKACFHIKKYDKETFSQIKDALKIGYDRWHKIGWI